MKQKDGQYPGSVPSQVTVALRKYTKEIAWNQQILISLQANLKDFSVRVSITCTKVSHEQAASSFRRSREAYHPQTATREPCFMHRASFKNSLYCPVTERASRPRLSRR
jgi:hypothetical protein